LPFDQPPPDRSGEPYRPRRWHPGAAASLKALIVDLALNGFLTQREAEDLIQFYGLKGA
jgi:hypothetical protein